MKQYKYGVVINNGVDEPQWVGGSTPGTSKKKLAEFALGTFNQNNTKEKSIVYLPQDTAFGSHQVEQPLFLCLSNGGYGTGGKSGFIHAVFDVDLASSGNYAAAAISAAEFKTQLSENEKQNKPDESDNYDAQNGAYRNIVFNRLDNEVKTTAMLRSGVYKILDTLFSGKKAYVMSDSQYDVEQLIKAALMQLPQKYANEISFNTCATTAMAAEYTTVCGVQSLSNPNELPSVKSNEAVLIRRSDCIDYQPESSFCKLLELDDPTFFKKDDNEISLLEDIYSRYAKGDNSLARLDECASAVYSYYLLTQPNPELINETIMLYSRLSPMAARAMDDALAEDNTTQINEVAFNYFVDIVKQGFFSGHFFNLDENSYNVIKASGAFKKIDSSLPPPDFNARGIVSGKSTLEQARFISFLVELAVLKSGNIDSVFSSLVRLILTDTLNAKQACKQVFTQCKPSVITEIWRRLQRDPEFDGASYQPLSHIYEVINDVFTTKEEKRELWRVSAGNLWLAKQAYSSLADIDEAEQMAQAFTSYGLGKDDTRRYCAEIFEEFCIQSPPNKSNYYRYRKIFNDFGCNNAAAKNKIDACEAYEKEGALSTKMYRARREFLQEIHEHQRLIGGSVVELPSELSAATTLRSQNTDYGRAIESEMNHYRASKDKKRKLVQYSGDFPLWQGMMVLGISVFIPMLISAVLILLGLPFKAFLAGLPQELGFSLRMLILALPIFASACVAVVSFIASSEIYNVQSRVVKSLINAFLWVIIPYLAAAVTMILLYFVI